MFFFFFVSDWFGSSCDIWADAISKWWLKPPRKDVTNVRWLHLSLSRQVHSFFTFLLKACPLTPTAMDTWSQSEKPIAITVGTGNVSTRLTSPTLYLVRTSVGMELPSSSSWSYPCTHDEPNEMLSDPHGEAFPAVNIGQGDPPEACLRTRLQISSRKSSSCSGNTPTTHSIESYFTKVLSTTMSYRRTLPKITEIWPSRYLWDLSGRSSTAPKQNLSSRSTMIPSSMFLWWSTTSSPGTTGKIL